jgi:uncharacterized protein YjaG (DUF416 family)
MTIRFHPEELLRELRALSKWHRLAFAAASAERLLPNYVAFARAARWGSADTLREALDYVWLVIERQRMDADEVQRLIARVETVTPDTEAFRTPFTSAALDAAGAVIETLHCVLDADPQRALIVATLARDTVDMFIQERDRLDLTRDRDFEQRIANDPLMRDELDRQHELLTELREQSALTQFFVRRLQSKAQNHGISNIRISI